MLLFAAVAGICACGSSKGYCIEGPANGAEMAVLTIWNVNGGHLRDTAVIQNDRFVFTGEADEVRMGEVLLVKKGEAPERNFLYIENSHLTLKDGKFYGGPNNDFYRDMDAVASSLDTLAPDYNVQLKKAMNECFAAHPDVEAAAFMYHVFNRDASLEELEEGFGKFTPRVQNSFLGKNAKDDIAARKATRSGIEAPQFTLNDREGNPVSLADFRGKYVLLDFWASWCRPCRASMPGLKEIYAAYRDKGLEIIGVSVDTDAAAWKKAVEDDQLPWIHVNDIKGEDSAAGKYGVKAIPTMFLIDPEGNMIGKMDHDALHEKLSELLD